MKRIEFSNEQINEIIDLYQNQNKSQNFIAEKYNISRSVIKRILNENLNKEEIRERTSQYQANYNSFENIDTPQKAYWLGFLAADGCVYVREHNASIILNIHERDVQHLEKFKGFLQSNVKINHHIQTEGYSNNTPMVKLVLNSKKMAQDLIDKGVTPRKSLTLNIPNIDKEYYLPYILGYFDGDGSISELKSGEFSISFVGTKEILEWINSVLNISNHLEKRQQNDSNNYYIRCGGFNKPYEILKQLYNSVNVHLDRKYEKFKTLEAVVLNRNVK